MTEARWKAEIQGWTPTTYLAALLTNRDAYLAANNITIDPVLETKLTDAVTDACKEALKALRAGGTLQVFVEVYDNGVNASGITVSIHQRA